MLWFATETSIRNSTVNALRLASQHGFTSIAFPLIGTGYGSFSESKALELMSHAIEQSTERPAEVRIVKYKA
ncbi:MAG: macro domain-containing protein [Candidatus Methylacidiphilales bacterium]